MRCLIRSDDEQKYSGKFLIKFGPTSPKLFVIASTGLGWDHVSVSLSNAKRLPTWDEMKKIRDMFFLPDEWAVQYNPPPSENISIDDFVLHLWRPQFGYSCPAKYLCVR